MESRQLDPLGQLLGSREKLPPSRHRHHLGGARLEKGWGRPWERYMVAQEGDKKLFHTLFVSWIRVFWVEGGSARLVSDPMLPFSSYPQPSVISTITSCSVQKTKYCNSEASNLTPP